MESLSRLRQKSLTSKTSGGRLRSSKSHGELSKAHLAWSSKEYPIGAEHYERIKEIGKGGNGTVWLAKCKPLDEDVALKIIEMDNMTCDLDTILRETQIMHEMRHPNVMPLYCSFVHGEQLWMIMPHVAGGSLYNIMQSNFPQGLEEEIVATVALDVLRGLDYMHAHGMLHRDVKAANVLINTDGRVVLSDFGVTANLERIVPSPRVSMSSPRASTSSPRSPISALGSLPEDSQLLNASAHRCGSKDSGVSLASSGGSLGAAAAADASAAAAAPPAEPVQAQPVPAASPCAAAEVQQAAAQQHRSAWACQKYLARNTFCGTPCFMAPEVMSQTEGYNLAADLWSFGILLEELALGRAPYANMSLTSVILTTLHQDAPTLAAQKTQRKFSEELHDIVGQCLRKDPADRPSCAQLLKHKFFKKAEDGPYLVKFLLHGSNGTPLRDMLRSVSRNLKHPTLHSKSSVKNFNVYATATLSGDVANAIALLKRMARPTSRRHKAGLLIPAKELAACQGVAFAILHKVKTYCGPKLMRGNGFVVARRPKGAPRRSKLFIHWADDTFRPGLSMLDAGLPRKEDPEDQKSDVWTAPSYFDVALGGLSEDFAHEEVEVIMLLPDQASVEVFRSGEGTLEHPGMHDSASSAAGESAAPIRAYAINGDADLVFELSLAGGRISENLGANERVFGGAASSPRDILSGLVRPPHEFRVLYKLLSSLSVPEEPEPNCEERAQPGAAALAALEERGCTMLYRMPQWLYDDDE